jgi:hypothetical protein
MLSRAHVLIAPELYMLYILENNFSNVPLHISCAAKWVESRLKTIPEDQQLKWVKKRLSRVALLELEQESIKEFHLTNEEACLATFAELVLGADIVLEYIYQQYTSKQESDVEL